jgi:RNA polymerase sigma-70 factor (ECF subfamily)
MKASMEGGPFEADARDARDARRGDPRAFERLLVRHAPAVHDVARRMLRDVHEAEDVVQHAFANAWRALDRFDEARPFRHWILRIATNLCRNRWQARRRRPGDRASGRPADDEASFPEPVAPAPEEEASEETEEARARVRRAIEALPERYRLVVVLRYVHDLSIEAIAEVTGHPPATVKTHLHRARAVLRERLERGGETPGVGRGTGP